ncbi:MAG: hypothetical protein NTZ80_00795 [Patescibacteria group bacterium]|nr:hypothetical protein [Patescibacteria group bacterium]
MLENLKTKPADNHEKLKISLYDKFLQQCAEQRESSERQWRESINKARDEVYKYIKVSSREELIEKTKPGALSNLYFGFSLKRPQFCLGIN